MMSLPQSSSAIEFTRPERKLDSVILPGDLSDRVQLLLKEWRQAEKLARFGIPPRNRVLLYGPPGNGKTTLAGAIACELGLPLGVAQYATLLAKYVNQSQQELASLFDSVRKTPAVLFFDEADAIALKRGESDSDGTAESNKTVNQLLMQLDKFPTTSVVIFATNFDARLDAAMKRRINLTLEMPSPTLADLKRLFQSIKKRNPLWPLKGFKVDGCGATSFADLESKVLDHAREVILNTDDPTGYASKPRSAWMRDRLKELQEEQDLVLFSKLED